MCFHTVFLVELRDSDTKENLILKSLLASDEPLYVFLHRMRTVDVVHCPLDTEKDHPIANEYEERLQIAKPVSMFK